MITHVAIIWKGKLYSLPKPNRHHHIIHMIHLDTGDMGIFGDQGFLDDKGIFLCRACALLHAQACNQIIRDIRPKDCWLYSENIW